MEKPVMTPILMTRLTIRNDLEPLRTVKANAESEP